MTISPATLRSSPLKRILSRFESFIHLEASSGILLLLCTVIALVWVNSPLAASYTTLWQTPFTVQVGQWGIAKPLLLWVNDGLMAIFFFVVGLEIKRELLSGELSSVRQALLPIAAAIGGMVPPALFYTLVNLGTPTISGWGIPMATDIAFALGVLALLGSRVPLALKVFLTALAIVDDIGAVLVIAVFYTEKVTVAALFVAAGVLALLIVLNRAGIRSLVPYMILGLILWVAVLKSGVHATIAGVLLAFTIPARIASDTDSFVDDQQELLNVIDPGDGQAQPTHLSERQQAALQAIETAATHVQTPLQRLEHALHPWVAFAIMPIFALANAGVAFEGNIADQLGSSVALGIIVGLAVGKPLGITLVSWLAVRLGWAVLPPGVTWKHIHGAGWLAGIGFTMALFIASLAFDSAATLANAKIGILFASLIAGTVGYTLLRTIKARP